MPNYSIRTRIMLSVLIAVIISSCIVSYAGYLNSREVVVKRLNNTEMPTLVKSIRNSINNEINEMKIVARSLAENTVFIDWVKNGANPETEKLVVKHLSKIVAANGFSNASFVDRESAKYWNQDGFLRVLEPNRDKWFFNFKVSGDSELASVYTSSKAKKSDIFVNYQEVSGRGMSGVSKPFDDMVDYLNSFKLEQTGYVFLTDLKGKVKVHNDDSLNEKAFLHDLFPGLNKNELLSKQDFASTEVNNQVISASYIDSLGWYVIAVIPKSELLSGINRGALQLIIILLFTSAFFAAVSYFLAKSLTRPISSMASQFSQLGQSGGDLTNRINEEQAPEIAELAKGFNAFVANIQHLFQDVVNTSQSVKSTSEGVNLDAENAKLASDKQRDEAHLVSVAITEMGSTIAEIADNANIAAKTTNDAADRATGAQNVVNESTLAINEMADEMETVAANIESLAEKTNNISGVLDVIRAISEQTNLLALNAAIEAARAGEHGRGFAVVADEVRGLAQRTNESTDEIHKMITELQDGAETAVNSVQKSKEQANLGVNAAKNTNASLQEIVGNILHISDLNTQIAAATEEQSLVIKEINHHVVTISDSSDQSAHAIGNIKTSSDSMKDSSLHLNSLVCQFKV